MIDRDLSKFISKASVKTKASRIWVYDYARMNFIDNFSAPSGFQMERYVMSLYPEKTLKMGLDEDGNFAVYVLRNGNDHNNFELAFKRVLDAK